MNDINVVECSKMLLLLDPVPPVTVRLDKWGSPYTSQKEHMCRWLNDQTKVFKGAYGRENSNTSTRTAYNRFMNPGGLLWLAEVLGEKETNLKAAIEAAVKEEKKNVRGRCAAFREVISFGRILYLYNSPEAWLYDPKLKRYLQLNPAGIPEIIPEKRKQALKIIEKEWNGN